MNKLSGEDSNAEKYNVLLSSPENLLKLQYYFKFKCRTHHNVFERKRRFRTKSFYFKQFQRFENNKVSPHQGIKALTKTTILVLIFHICNNNLFYKDCNNRIS